LVLREREAKHGGNVPLELLSQIDDYQKAVELVEARLDEQISDEALTEPLAPLRIITGLPDPVPMLEGLLQVTSFGLIILATVSPSPWV
jgi:hypothetical protein